MSHCFSSTPRKARKNHNCTACAGKIYAGEIYMTWASVDDCFYTSKVHPECFENMGSEEYSYGDYDRPDYRLTNLGLLLLFEKWGWRTDQVKNYQRPVLTLGLL
jgi:hypothetical protein